MEGCPPAWREDGLFKAKAMSEVYAGRDRATPEEEVEFEPRPRHWAEHVLISAYTGLGARVLSTQHVPVAMCRALEREKKEM